MRSTTAPPRSAVALAPTVACLALLVPASAQTPGSFTTADCGCPEVTDDSGPVLYGRMPAGGWHLDGANLTFEHAAGAWSVRAGGTYLPRSGSATILSAGDDGVLGPLTLPFPFTYPGGAGVTSAIDVNTNGRVYLEAGTNSYANGWSASQVLPNFLSATPSVCALGVDLNPGAGGLVSYETRLVGPAAVALVTWEDVPEYPDVGGNTVQCQLWSTGELVVCHVATNGAASAQEALVGVSAGGGAADPGPSGLETPLTLYATGEPQIGATMTVGVRGVPSTATLAVLGLGAGLPPAPVPLTPLGTPAGCTVWIDQLFEERPMSIAPPVAETTLDLGYVPAHVGFTAQLQAFVIDPGQGTAFPLIVSDRGTLTLGAPPALRFVVSGANSYEGAPAEGGFFRLESGTGATHPDVVGLEVSLVGQPQWFDVEGNAGYDDQGFFDDGDGTAPGSSNAFHGTDATTGLVYGAPGQPVSCDGTGTTGWVGFAAVGGSSTRFRRLDFEFTDFQPGETFGFCCDTDGGDPNAGAHAVHVVVTFSDLTTVSGTVQFVADDRAEGVLLP